MVLYICEKCNKEFNRKSNYLCHLNKKISCTNSAQITHNSAEITHIPIKNISEINNSKPDLSCKYCLKLFTRKDICKRHMEISCKIKKQNENKKEEIFKQLIKNQNEEHKKQCEEFIRQRNEQNKIINTLITQVAKLTSSKLNKNIVKNSNNKTTTTNSNNTTNNIVMIDFGKEDLQIIDKSEFIKLVNNSKITGVKITEEILKIIHFNYKYPQLNNIYVSDINRSKCMIAENNEWKLSPIDQIPKVIENIIKYSNANNQKLTKQHKDNKSIINRLQIIDKYTKLADEEHLQELIEDEAPKKEIERCKNFKQATYDAVKTGLYNKGKKIKKLK
jgi:hypothetical protein